MNNYNYEYLNNNQYHDYYEKKPQEINSYKGFIRGNLFENLYEPYKNYHPSDLVGSSERQKLMLKVQQYQFAMIDLQLYLDVNPNDDEAIKLYNNYRDLAYQAILNYEQYFGPLTASNNPVNTKNWIYINSPWPWEVVA